MYRVTTVFSGTLITGGGINRLYFADTGGLTAQNAVTAAGNFWNAIRPQMSTSVTWTTQPIVDVMDPVSGNITSQIPVTGSSFSGTNGAAQIAKATQGLLQLRTGIFVGGREVRGRIFIPGCTTTSVSAGNADSVYTAALVTAGQAMIADANSTLGVWSKTHGTFVGVVTSSSPSKLAVLRSRRD